MARFVESPEAKFYFWHRYKKLIPIALAVFLLVGLVLGCAGDREPVAPMASQVQAVGSGPGEAAALALVGHTFRHLHVPLVRFTLVGFQDGAFVSDVRVNGSHQLRVTIEAGQFIAALKDYQDITGLVDGVNPGVF